MNNLWFSVTSNRIIFTCKVMNRDVFVGMWAKWMKTTQPICHSQRWKRAAATWSFKLVRTVSTFLPTPLTANELIKLDHKKQRSTQTSALHFSPPLPSSLVILPALDVWDTDVAIFQCWPWSIVVSTACGKCIFPLGPRNQVIVLHLETSGSLHTFILV